VFDCAQGSTSPTFVGQVKFQFKMPNLAEIRRTLRYHKLHVVHRSRDPHPAAFSFALGVFLGLMPISVLATMIALFVPRKLGMRTLPAVIGTFTSNWLTAPFILAASAMLGQLLTKGEVVGFRAMLPPENLGWHEQIRFFLNQGKAFLVGITVFSILGGALAYAIVYWSVEAAVKLRRARVMERMRSHIHMPHVHLPHVHLPHWHRPESGKASENTKRQTPHQTEDLPPKI
jgi:uncharacterized protein (DUF2062 family)